MAFLSQKERRDQMESDAGGRLIPDVVSYLVCVFG